MTTTPNTPVKKNRFPVSVQVEVEAWEIEEAGYHHEDDCPANTGKVSDSDALNAAVQLLHEQAHGDPKDALFADTCLRQPCYGLYGGGL